MECFKEGVESHWTRDSELLQVHNDFGEKRLMTSNEGCYVCFNVKYFTVVLLHLFIVLNELSKV